MADFPLVVERQQTRNLASWGEQHRHLLREMLDESGAVLLRGFDVEEPKAFADFMAAATSGALPYTERSSPRRPVIAEDNIFTSTQYAQEHEIFLHNEQSYNLQFPMIIAFCCLRPATERGETPIANTRKIYRQIPAAVRDELHRRKYMYLRNFDGQFGLPWQTAFQLSEAHEVETYCQANQIDFKWRAPGQALTTQQVREVVARHPRTKELCWFNHATFFNLRNQQPEVLEVMLEFYGDERRLPHSTWYGDGSRIPAEVIDELRAAYEAEKVIFKWEKGDVLLLDNLLASHGRSSFRGERTVIAAMADAINWESVAVGADEALV